MRKLINSHTESHKHLHKDLSQAISIENLTFRYSRKSEDILKNFSLNISKGEFTTILGPNGSGKSTLVKAIVKAHKPQKGIIYTNGKLLSPKEFAKEVSYIPQMIEIPHGISVYDFVSFGRTPYLGLFGKMTEKDKEIVESAMKTINVWEWKDKNTEDLSGGQRQRVLVAMALAQNTDIVILDEPTTYLDIKAQYELLELMDELHDLGKTIIVVLHNINQAVQYSDKVIILKEGEIYSQGVPEDILTIKMLKDVYGVETTLYTDHNKRKYVTDIKLINSRKKKVNEKSIK